MLSRVFYKQISSPCDYSQMAVMFKSESRQIVDFLKASFGCRVENSLGVLLLLI